MPAISTTIRRSSLLAAWRLRVRRYYRTPPRWRGCGSGEITTLDRSGRCPLLVQVVHVSPQLDLAAWLLTRLCSRVQHQPVSDVLELIGIRGIGEPLLVRIVAGALFEDDQRPIRFRRRSRAQTPRLESAWRAVLHEHDHVVPPKIYAITDVALHNN